MYNCVDTHDNWQHPRAGVLTHGLGAIVAAGLGEVTRTSLPYRNRKPEANLHPWEFVEVGATIRDLKRQEPCHLSYPHFIHVQDTASDEVWKMTLLFFTNLIRWLSQINPICSILVQTYLYATQSLPSICTCWPNTFSSYQFARTTRNSLLLPGRTTWRVSPQGHVTSVICHILVRGDVDHLDVPLNVTWSTPLPLCRWICRMQQRVLQMPV